jgi:dipeptidyl-peptidase-4
MKVASFFIFLFAIQFASFAQSELTLSEAVMEQWRKFRPEHVFNFQWVPNSTDYSYIDDYTTLVLHNSKRKRDTKITIEEVNKWIGAELSWFSGMEWLDKDCFKLTDGQKYYCVDPVKKTGKVIFDAQKQTENSAFNLESLSMAYTRKNNLYVYRSGEEIALTNHTDNAIVAGQAIARSEFGIRNGIFWAPKGNLLAFYEKDESDVAEYPFLDITKTPGVTSFIRYPMTGQMSEKPKVGIYSLSNKSLVYIQPRGASDDYLTNVSWSPDERYLILAEVTRDQKKMQVQLYDAAGKFVRTLFTEENKRYVEPEHPAYFINETQFIWFSEKTGNTNLYLCDINGSIEQLTNNPWEALSFEGLSRNKSAIFFMGTGESPLDTKLFQVELRSKKQFELTKAPGTHEAKVSPNGMLIFDQFSSITTPNLAQITDINGKTLKKILEAEDKLKSYKIGITALGKIKAKDGNDLHTRLIKPSNFDENKKYPVLVYVYGGPHAQLITNSYLTGANLWMHWMAEQGYLVFTLDNRGSAHRGFQFESQIHRQVGTVEVEDQMTGVEYLKSLPYVDANRLAVHGWSFGGFMTISLMLRQPGTFTTGVAGGPVTDWKYYEAMYGERYMDTPETNPEGYAASSLLNKTNQLKGDLLIIHGGVDDVVVPQHSQALLKAFIDAGKQIDFFEYPTHQHNVRGKDRVHLIEKILKYIMEKNV